MRWRAVELRARRRANGGAGLGCFERFFEVERYSGNVLESCLTYYLGIIHASHCVGTRKVNIRPHEWSKMLPRYSTMPEAFTLVEDRV